MRRIARARVVKLAVYQDGRFVVTAPKWASVKSIEQLIGQKAQWIIDSLAKFASLPPRLTPVGNRADYLRYREAARKLAHDRLAFFNQTYKLPYGRITIRNQRTRWGSCSKKGNLNFTYKIALLEPRLADYIIVHELCHVAQFNHSQAFWDLVAQTIPEHKTLRRQLKSR